MAGDLLVLLRYEDPHRATRSGIVDRIARGPVPSLVESDAKPGQAATDRRPRLDIIFADTACKHDQICSIKRREHRGDLLAHGIAKHRDGKSRIGI